MNDKFTWESGDIVIDISDDDEWIRTLPGYEDELDLEETIKHEMVARADLTGKEDS